MLTFAEFEAAAPEVALPIRAKLEAGGLGFFATVRRDGSPRISPMEVSFIGDGMYVGSMPGAMKARDLQRDPRCALLTPIADKDDLSGEGKLFLTAVEITDPEAMRALLRQMIEGTEMTTDDFGDSHMFEMRVIGAAWQKVEGDNWTTASWRPGESVRHRRRSGAAGQVVDV